MQDIYRRSREEEEEGTYIESELRKFHPNLQFRKFTWVDNPLAHLVIDDISLRFTSPQVEAAVRIFESLCRGGIKVYSMGNLARALYRELSSLLEFCDSQRTLLVFPGEGAETVKAAIPEITTKFPSVTIEAHRIKDSQGMLSGIDIPHVREWFDTVNKEMLIKNIVVIDDVIDTGATIEAVRKKVGWGHAQWFGAAAIVYSPLIYPQRLIFPSSIEGYERIFAGKVIQGVNNPIPLNSLTSFVEGGEKTQRLIRKCLDLFVPEEEHRVFLDTCCQLSELLTIVE